MLRYGLILVTFLTATVTATTWASPHCSSAHGSCHCVGDKLGKDTGSCEQRQVGKNLFICNCDHGSSKVY